MYIIYGKNNCIWCTRAKMLLDFYFIEYEFYNIEEDPGAMKMFKETFPDAKTVPQIVDNKGNIIGTYNDLDHYLAGD